MAELEDAREKRAFVDTYPGSWGCLEVVQIMRVWSDAPFFTAKRHAKQRGVL